MKIDKSKYIVRSIDLITARCLVEKYHYAKSGSIARVFTHGLFLKEKSFFDYDCLGVAWWLPPTPSTAKSLNVTPDKILSLTRFVLTPEVPKNGASFLLGKSIKLLKKTDYEILVTYADEAQGHEGIIYKATNWEYKGKSRKTPIWKNSKGQIKGQKRAGNNLTAQQMNDEGFILCGHSHKHRYIYKLKKRK